MRITWGVMRGEDGEPLCTVFCNHCMTVFQPRYVTPGHAVEIKASAEASHYCQKQLELGAA